MDDVQELFLIRHGTTDMSGTLCGHVDPPLNAAGRYEASGLVSLLRHHDVSLIYTSDLLRAVQTAEFLTQELGVPVVVRADLREISFGEWEGKRWSELKATLASSGIQSLESSPEAHTAGGESFASFRDRASRALKDIARTTDKRPIAVITHQGVIRVALQHIAEAPDPNPQQAIHPCGVYRFAVRGETFTYTGQLTAT